MDKVPFLTDPEVDMIEEEVPQEVGQRSVELEASGSTHQPVKQALQTKACVL